MQKIKIIFLGTNGWFDTKTGNTICILVETDREYLILDAGNGFYKIDTYIKEQKPIYLFLSHFHLDHIIGLHTLIKFSFFHGIDIYGPPGIKKYIGSMIEQPFTAPITQLKTRVSLHDLHDLSSLPLQVEYKELLHYPFCYGYRFSIMNKIISYCPDTGICENAFKLAERADLLIAECTFKSGQSDNSWPHLNPEDAAVIAQKANAKKLALVHFNADLYKSLKERKTSEMQAKKIFKNTFASKDDQILYV